MDTSLRRTLDGFSVSESRMTGQSRSQGLSSSRLMERREILETRLKTGSFQLLREGEHARIIQFHFLVPVCHSKCGKAL